MAKKGHSKALLRQNQLVTRDLQNTGGNENRASLINEQRAWFSSFLNFSVTLVI